MLLKNLQYVQKKPTMKSLFNKLAGLTACNFIKKRLQRRCFPVNIEIFKSSFFIEHLRWLPLNHYLQY